MGMPSTDHRRAWVKAENNVCATNGLLSKVALEYLDSVDSNKACGCLGDNSNNAGEISGNYPTASVHEKQRSASRTHSTPRDCHSALTDDIISPLSSPRRDARLVGMGNEAQDEDGVHGEMRDFESPATYPLVRIKRKYLRRRYVNPMADNIAKARSNFRSHSVADVEQTACIKHLHREHSAASQIAEKYQERAKTFVKQASKIDEENKNSNLVMRYHPRIPRKLKPLFHHTPPSSDQTSVGAGVESQKKSKNNHDNEECRRTYVLENTINKQSPNGNEKRVQVQEKTYAGRPERPLPKLDHDRSSTKNKSCANTYEKELEARKAIARKRLQMLKPMFAALPESTDVMFLTKR